MTDPVHSFWEKQAQDFGTSDLATAPDHYYRELEIGRIKDVIAGLTHNTILDVGCGNGYSTIKLAQIFPDATIVGIDYSGKMVDAAKAAAGQAGIANAKFFVGDVLALSEHVELKGKKFDIVLTERCLINLANTDEHEQSLLQLRDLLAPSGHLMLVENTAEGLGRLNELRASIGLPAINQRWHNCYLSEEKLKAFVPKHFKQLQSENIGNLYYILSRVVYAKLAQMAGEEPRYDHPINEIAAKLPSLGDHAYSPNFLMVWAPLPK